MIQHPAVRKVNFTGSTAVGRKVATTCGQNLKPCLMELGGKNSAIVCSDADLDLAARKVLAGAFLNVCLLFTSLPSGHQSLVTFARALITLYSQVRSVCLQTESFCILLLRRPLLRL